MSDKVPPLYLAYRTIWSALHLALVLLLAALVIAWWVRDGHGAALLEAWGHNVSEARSAIANVLPFPWG
jgi:uncharacterized membrane protein YqjE